MPVATALERDEHRAYYGCGAVFALVAEKDQRGDFFAFTRRTDRCQPADRELNSAEWFAALDRDQRLDRALRPRSGAARKRRAEIRRPRIAALLKGAGIAFTPGRRKACRSSNEPPGRNRARVTAAPSTSTSSATSTMRSGCSGSGAVAVAHWHSVCDPAHQDDYFWVVVRHEIDYLRAGLRRRPAALPGPGSARLPRAPASTVMSSSSARTARSAFARTDWAIIDSASGRPIRVPAEVAEPFLR